MSSIFERVNYLLENNVTIETTVHDSPTKYVIAVAWLDGSFHLGTSISKAVKPEDFDQNLGIGIAKNRVLALAKDKLFELEGYSDFKANKSKNQNSNTNGVEPSDQSLNSNY